MNIRFSYSYHSFYGACDFSQILFWILDYFRLKISNLILHVLQLKYKVIVVGVIVIELCFALIV